MELNYGQTECIEKLCDWWENHRKHKQIFEISGPAGSGKTTIIREMINRLPDVELKNVLFVAFVGKAAMQMKKNGLNAATIHSTIFTPVRVKMRDNNGQPIMEEGRYLTRIKFVKVTELPKEIKLIVVDEAPMVDRRLAMDLISFGLPIIALGDLHQLPPIFGDPVFMVHPDYQLTEVMRQAKDSPILALSQEIIHADKRLHFPRGNTENLQVYTKEDFLYNYTDLLLEADIVICGKNGTRDDLNALIRRKRLAREGINADKVPELTIGDKIICRKNNWSRFEDKGEINLINGMIGTVRDIEFESKTSNTINITFEPDGFPNNPFMNLPINIKYYKGDKETKARIKASQHDGELFELGYAITCHLSQGSQYDTVVLYIERMGDFEYFKKWVYTGITRAKNKLIIVI